MTSPSCNRQEAWLPTEHAPEAEQGSAGLALNGSSASDRTEDILAAYKRAGYASGFVRAPRPDGTAAIQQGMAPDFQVLDQCLRALSHLGVEPIPDIPVRIRRAENGGAAPQMAINLIRGSRGW